MRALVLSGAVWGWCRLLNVRVRVVVMSSCLSCRMRSGCGCERLFGRCEDSGEDDHVLAATEPGRGAGNSG